ncbi:ABC transporter permease [Oenococcus oeni]|uniref:ABC transporter permease n=1 Tax=Oenococcus oeni TaxID=1247 RepID=UPI0008F8F87E|nr:ABC transporter permease [Oenococcus oeni]OIM08115.1 sodium ABC transporter permease [Oenococcus oeni]
MNKTWIVAKHVFLKNLKSPSYYWMLLSPFVFVLIGIGASFLINKAVSGKQPTIGIVGQPQQVSLLKTALKSKASVKSESSLKAAKNALSNEKIDAYVKTNAGYTKTEIVANSKSSANFDSSSISQIISSLKTESAVAKLGLSAKQVKSITAPASVKTKYVSVENKKVSQNSNNGGRSVRYLFAQGATIIIFMFLAIYIQMTGSEIGTEKGSRILESILAAVPARQHFTGKIIAIVGLFIFQLIAYIFIALIAFALAKPFNYSKYLNLVDWSQLGTSFIVLTALITLGAIIIYIILAAVFASMVSRQEDVAKSTSVVMWIAMVPYFLSFAVASSANAPVFKVLSFIPLISQSTMPIRMAVSSATTFDALIALALQILIILLLVKFASGIYARNSLDYGDGKPLKKLLKYFQSKNS